MSIFRMKKLEEVKQILHEHQRGTGWDGVDKGTFEAWFRWHASAEDIKKLEAMGCEVLLTSSMGTPLTRVRC
jgi:hypothetical protein